MLDKVIDILSKAVVKKIAVYDMEEISPFYDYFVIGSVNSNRQGAAAINYLKKDMPLYGSNVKSFSASNESGWFLIDLGSIVVHVFVGEERLKYDLDNIYRNHLVKYLED